MNKNLQEIGKEMNLPDINQLDLKKNHGIFLKIGIVSETCGFFINRNNEATEITSESFSNEDRLVVPASKWRGAERSYLLSELRKVPGIIPEDYSRNMATRKVLLRNPSSLVYGDSSTGSGNEAAGIASRLFYDWSYSFEPLAKISMRLTHNSLSEEGTILHEENGKVKSNAIFNSPYVKPGVKLVRYITVENCSIEMLALILIAVSGTTRYGARTAILGDNIKNKIVAIGYSKRESAISSFTTVGKCWETGNYNAEEAVLSDMKETYGSSIIESEKLKQLLKLVQEIKDDKNLLKEICEVLNTKMDRDWEEFWGENTKKERGSKQANLEDSE
jgi:CRISPR-associated protein Csc2